MPDTTDSTITSQSTYKTDPLRRRSQAKQEEETVVKVFQPAHPINQTSDTRPSYRYVTTLLQSNTTAAALTGACVI